MAKAKGKNTKSAPTVRVPTQAQIDQAVLDFGLQSERAGKPNKRAIAAALMANGGATQSEIAAAVAKLTGKGYRQYNTVRSLRGRGHKVWSKGPVFFAAPREPEADERQPKDQPEPESHERLHCRISSAATAEVIFDGPITQRAIEKLVAHLQLSKDSYPEEIDSQSPESGA